MRLESEVFSVRVSYNKLFKLLIDKQMRKGELCSKADISTASIGKLVKGQNISVDILVKICDALDCSFEDIMELLPKDEDVDTK